MATGDELFLKSLRRLCRREARLEVLIALDPTRDGSELDRLGLRELSREYLEQEVVPAYEANGFVIEDYGMLPSPEWPEIESSWAKKLRRSSKRVLIYLHAVSGKLSSVGPG